MSILLLDDNNEARNQYLNLVKKIISEGKIISLFNTQIEYIRDTENIKDSREKEEVIDYSMSVLEDACIEVLKCKTCIVPFEFRFCKNPSFENDGRVSYAVELNCLECGDNFTLHEGNKLVSYFNINVLKKIYNLRRWERGLEIMTSMGD